MITQEELIALLKEQAPPTQQEKWAKAHNVWPATLSDTLNGRRDPGPSILAALGYERVILYRKIDKQRAAGIAHGS